MYTVVLVINLLICVALIGLVLLQRSEGGALGMGGGGSGSLMSGRGAADALARMTGVAGGLFLACSFLLTFMAGASRSAFDRSILDQLTPAAVTAPASPAPTPQRESSTPLLSPAPAEGAAPAQAIPASAPQPAAASGPTAPAPTQAAARAGPMSAAPAPARAGPATLAPRVAAAQPAQATPRPAASGATPAQRPAATQPSRPRPAVTQPAAESVETPPPDLPPLRPRAGPDQ